MEKPTILKGRYVWDGLQEKAISNGAVLIEKGFVCAVGPSAEILTAFHDAVCDWPQATLLPGLIDSHTHLSMDGSLENYLDRMSDNAEALTRRATAMMRKDLIAGVTTCRCLGDREFLDIGCREAVEHGEVSGPRLLVATRGIRAPHGHGFVGYPFKGEEEIRRAIRENIARGADLIKIYITGTLKGEGNLPPYLSREEIRLAIEESHAAGLRIASHCVGGTGLDWAVELGLDTLEHAYHITARQTEQLANSNTALVLTPGAVLSEERVRRLPPALIQGHLEERDRMFASMALTVKARIPFGVGTDGMHGDLADDIACLIALGATNREALQAATVRGARICGIENETGSLRQGMRADIIAVQGNPLEDTGALRKVIAVISKGKLVHEGGKLKQEFVYGPR
ncbi:MAG TPA: amidohydrolase family protein [Cyclobacteriaceae bacterium]